MGGYRGISISYPEHSIWTLIFKFSFLEWHSRTDNNSLKAMKECERKVCRKKNNSEQRNANLPLILDS